MIKVGLVGLGKRTKLFNLPILNQLRDKTEIVGVTTKSGKIDKGFELIVPTFTSSKEMIEETNPDFVIVSVPHTAAFSVMMELISHSNIPILVDTPISLDLREVEIVLVNAQHRNVPIGVIEDWPYLPIECFKKVLLDEEEMGHIVAVENDYRTYDYHGTAQMRSYLDSDLYVTSIKQDGLNYMMPDCVRKDGNFVKNEIDAWKITIAKLNNGALIINKYSSQYKKVDFRISNSLRVYSTHSTIISDCLLDKDFKASVIDSEGKTCELALKKEYDQDVIKNLSTILPSGKEVKWDNPFIDMKLTETQIGVMYHINSMVEYLNSNQEKLLYEIKDFFEDMKLFYGKVS